MLARVLNAFAREAIHAALGVVVFRGSGVHGEHDVAARLVARGLARLNDVLQGLFVGLQVGSETALVAHAATEASFMQNLLQRVINLGAPTQALGERLGANRHNHEFLEVNVVVGMHAAVENVHHGRRQHMGIRTANVAIQRQLARLGSSTCASERSAQNGVRTQVALVRSTVDVDHFGVDSALVASVHADNGFGNFLIHMGDGLLNALAKVAALIAVTQFNSLECARRCARRNDRAGERTVVEGNLDLNRGVAAGIENLSAVDVEDDAHEVSSYDERTGTYKPRPNSEIVYHTRKGDAANGVT